MISLVSQSRNTVVAATSLPVTIPATAAGDALILEYGGGAGAPVTSISGGGTWQRAKSSNVSRPSEVWYCLNCSAGVTTVTVTMPSTNAMAYVQEWAGLPLTGLIAVIVDASNSVSYPSSTVCTTASVTTTQAADLIIATIKLNQTWLTGPTGGWTGFTSVALTDSVVAGYLIPGVTGTFNTSWTFAAGGTGDSVIVAFFARATGTKAASLPMIGVQ